MNHIELYLSIISLGIGIGNTFYLFFKNYKNIKISILEKDAFHKSDNSELNVLLTFQCLIENKSNLPISINSIEILDKTNSYKCDFNKQLVKSNKRTIGNQVISQIDTFSLEFPINLAPLCSTSGYIILRTAGIIFEPANYKCIVYTNRGTIRTSVFIPGITHNN